MTRHHGRAGKYDIDHGARINGMNIAIASLMNTAGFARWKGHDMQPRAYDSEDQAIDRVVRSVLSWEACEASARQLDIRFFGDVLKKEYAKAEDMIRHAVVYAQKVFDEMYK
jgi:xylose isomerase